MSLEFKEREKEGILLLDLKGRLQLGDEDFQFRQRINSLKERGHAKIVVNLEHVGVIDNTGLSTLRLFSREFQSRGGKLALVSPSVRHLEPSVVLAIETEFEIFDDEQEAINSFFPDRASRRIDLIEAIRELQSARS